MENNNVTSLFSTIVVFIYAILATLLYILKKTNPLNCEAFIMSFMGNPVTYISNENPVNLEVEDDIIDLTKEEVSDTIDSPYSIISAVKTINTVDGLASLLNKIKENEIGEDAYKITKKQLSYYSDARRSRSAKQFKIPKKKGGFRVITSPCNGHKNILKYINIILNALYVPMDCVNGFTEDRSVVTNAYKHVGQNYIFNIDLKDFFNSFTEGRVYKVLQLKPYCLNKKIASLIAGLCSMHVEGYETAILPQGSPTSPTLTNILCHQLDRRLTGLANRFRLHYSRYADDITFSSNHNVYQENSEFRKELVRIIESQGLHINPEKTRLQKKFKDTQEVTGLIISDKVNVTRKYVSDIRFVLHLWEKFGYEATYERFYKMYKSDKGHIKGEPTLENVISGKLEYLKMVKGPKDSTYMALYNKFTKLTSIALEPTKPSANKYQYIVSYSIPEFEIKYKTEIQIETVHSTGYVKAFFLQNENKVPVFISKFLTEKFIPRTNALSNKYNELAKEVKDKTLSQTDANIQYQSFKKSYNEKMQGSCENLKKFFSQIKGSCFITLCTKNNKPNWLVTEKKPKFVISDIKDLTIDSFLKMWEEKGLDEAAKLYNEYIEATSLPTEKILQVWENSGIGTATKVFENPNYDPNHEG